ncbi:NB-ARC domain-containing protein [Planktothrix agardhii]|uniref:NB-ARC domain-containing protein n=1 Tax=Planktothrix agardhii TaxID=1160 RepID=UPI00040A836F|nr:ATP-binding protein [Planktothrix agardhii]
MQSMDVKETVDRLVFAETGKHLSDIQKKVIEGICQEQSYDDISEKSSYHYKYVADIAAKLYKIISKQLKLQEKAVNQSTFLSTIEAVRMGYIGSQVVKANDVNGIGINNNFNLYSNTANSKSNNGTSEAEINTLSNYQDLSIAPRITKFYDRASDLATLSEWILTQNIPLIAVLGLTGIGKTTLVKRFIDLNSQQFEVIIWRSLKFPKSLNDLLTNILNRLSDENKSLTNIEDRLTKLFEILRQKKCLIILDNLENIFMNGQLAGQYQPEYGDYKTLFEMTTQIEHQSSLISISQEKCREMVSLDDDLGLIKTLELNGLNDVDFLSEFRLTDRENWSKLIDLYDGNPLYLKHIGTLIKDVFSGKVSNFLNENSTLLNEDLKSIFNQKFIELSTIEQQIIFALTQPKKSFSIDDLKSCLSSPITDIADGLRSLNRRYLLKKIGENESLFTLKPLWIEYAIAKSQIFLK